MSKHKSQIELSSKEKRLIDHMREMKQGELKVRIEDKQPIAMEEVVRGIRL